MVTLDEGTTNQGFLLELLNRPELRAGKADTGWLDRLQAEGEVGARAPRRRRTHPGRDRALRRRHRRPSAARFYALARRGRPAGGGGRRPPGRPAAPGHRLPHGAASRPSPRQYVVEADGARPGGRESSRSPRTSGACAFGERSHRTMTALQDRDLLVEVDGVPHRISRDEGGLVRSHGPGRRRRDPRARPATRCRPATSWPSRRA